MEILLVLFLFTLVFVNYSFSTKCDVADRKYACESSLVPSNRSVYVERNGRYDSPINDNFVQAIRSLQYCQGSFYCKPDFKANQLIDVMFANSHLVCFSDENCLSDGHEITSNKVNSMMRVTVGETCIYKKCTDPKDILTFNISNDAREMDVYKCIKIGPFGIKSQFCLRPFYKSFAAIEKLCSCDFRIQNCSCSTYCPSVHTSISDKTYAIFLSFGDIYVAAGSTINYLGYFILAMLCIGSIAIVIVFCNFYITLSRIASCNDTRSTEALRRILSATLQRSSSLPLDKDLHTCATISRGSPPPTYEQVLREKCVEFKKNVV